MKNIAKLIAKYNPTIDVDTESLLDGGSLIKHADDIDIKKIKVEGSHHVSIDIWDCTTRDAVSILEAITKAHKDIYAK